MSLEFVSPLENKKRIYDPFNSQTEMDYEKNDIFLNSIKLKYEIYPHFNNDSIIIGFKEGNNHKEVVHIFSRNILTCSCKDYVKKELNFCKHLAIVHYYLNYFIFSNQDSEGYNFKQELIKNIRKIKFPKDKKYVFYDSFEKKVKSVGSGSENVYTPSFKKYYILNKNKVGLFDKYCHLLPKPYELLDNIVLRPNQQESMQLMIDVKRAICGMPPGVGKTITTIAIMDYLKIKDALIICPKSIGIQWQDELKIRANIDSMIVSKKNIEKFLEKENIGICTYQTFARNINLFKEKFYKFVVLDEIQYIKNDESKTWSAINKIKSEYLYGLSGTIIENRIDDLYSLAHIIDEDIFGPKWKFNQNYKEVKSWHRKKIMYQPGIIKNLPQLKETISTFVYSNSQEKLPILKPNNNYVELGPKAKKYHDNYIEMANKLIRKSLDNSLSHSERMMIQAYLLKARLCCNSLKLVDANDDEPSPKFDKIREHIDNICDKEDKKLVLFSQWTKVLDLLQKDSIHGFVRFDGTMTQNDRRKSLNRFKEDKDCKIFFSSDAGGVGVDGLQFVCNDMIHVELPWNPARIDQRNGRLHRIMQKYPHVNINYFITKDSIESKIEQLIKDKKEVRVLALYS